MQLLSLVFAGLTVMAAEPAKSRPAGLDAAAIVEQAKQLHPQQQQAWLRRLERRLSRAITLVLKPADAEKKLAEYQAPLGHNPPDWQQVAKLVQHTDVAEKAAIGQLTRQYRIALYESLFGQRKEYELRHDALRRVLKAWEDSGQPFSRQEVLLLWLAEAVRCNTRGSIAPLPPDPDFSKDPPLELPPEPDTAKQPADNGHGQPPKLPPAEKETPKSPPSEQKPKPPSGEEKARSPAIKQELPRPSPPQPPWKPADGPREPGTPAAARHSPDGAPPAETTSGESRAIRSLLERLGSAPVAEPTPEQARFSEAPAGRSDAIRTPDGAGESQTPLEPGRKAPTEPAGMSEPPEPPIWDKPPPPAAQQHRPSSAATDVARPPRDAPAIDGVVAVPQGETSAEPVQPLGWPEQRQQSAPRMAMPAPLRETDGAAAPQLAAPSIQTDYHGGGLDLVLELQSVCVDDSLGNRSPVPPEVSLPARRTGSTHGATVLLDDAGKPVGTRRPVHAPPLELLALRPVPLEQLPMVQVNLADLNARINGYNYSLRALEAELHGAGAWDSARIRPAIERLKKLSAQRRDLEVFRELLPAEQRKLAADFEPVRPIVVQLAQRISSARQAAEQARSAAPQEATSAQAAAAELERLDALSRELAEYGRQ